MIIRFFRENQITGLIALPVVTLLFWLLSYYYNETPVSITDSGPLFNWINDYIKPFTFAKYVPLLILISQVLYLDNIVNRYEILYKGSHLPGLMYIVCMGIFPGFIGFHPVLLVNSLLLFVMDNLFGMYKKPSAMSNIFNAAFLLGLATLIYVPSIILYLLLLTGIVLLRPYAWRDWVVSLIGLALPFFFISIYFLWIEQLQEFWAYIFKFINNLPEFRLSSFDHKYYFTVGVVSALMLLTFRKLQINFYKNFIRTRRYQQVLLAFLVLSLASIMLSLTVSLTHFAILAIPVSIFLGYYFLALKKIFWTETFFLILISAIIYNYLFI